MQPEYAVDGAKLRWLNQAGIRHDHRVEGAIEFFCHKGEEILECREFRKQIVILLDIGLQQRGMIRHPIEDLCRGQPHPKTFFRKSSETMPSSIPSTLLHSSRLSSPSRSFTPLIAPKAAVVCDGHHRPGSLRPPLHGLMTEFGCRVLVDCRRPTKATSRGPAPVAITAAFERGEEVQRRGLDPTRPSSYGHY